MMPIIAKSLFMSNEPRLMGHYVIFREPLHAGKRCHSNMAHITGKPHFRSV